ncbi:amidohydrolase family protein [Dyadobacter sp. 3J3]|uniref:amidohydrolase family protein n=1 Tax=Dyadobacter sp. 3J3 TaxID=2606600 RepID=UPI001359171F|nr:amidohydrolase family protein [Dyadobacter sp. 3J3]
MRLIISFALFFISTIVSGQNSKGYLIKVGKLYDVQKKTFLKNQQILVVDGVIEHVGSRLKKPTGIKTIDLSNCTVTPGLIDMHTHLLFHQKQDKNGFEQASKMPADERIKRGVTFAGELLNSGITTARDLGNSGQFLDIALQKQLAEKKDGSLTLFGSGPILSPPGGQFGKLAPADSFLITQEYREIRGAEDARAAVLDHIKHGVNVIKVCINTDNRVLAPEEISAITQTAHENGLSVTAHATFDKAARDAVLAGVNGIEHGYSLSDTTLILMKQRGTYLVPTDVSRDLAMILVAGVGMTGKEADDYATDFLKGVHDRLRRAVDQGVTIVAGSDFYLDLKVGRGRGAVDVLLSYYEAGIPANELLRYATFNAAKALGIADHTGEIRKGMRADLTFFNGDMEKDFPKALLDVKMVMKGGHTVYQKNHK